MADRQTVASLADTARALAVDPLDVVRLCVATETEPGFGFALPSTTVQTLVEAGGLDDPWPPLAGSHTIDRLRAGLAALGELRSGHAVRLDRLTQGLDRDARASLVHALEAAQDEGWVTIANELRGRFVALADGSSEPLQAFLDGAAAPPRIAETLAAPGKDDVA